MTDQPPVCCVCGGGPVAYRNYREQPFCWPCANCQCVQNPCIRTGVNDPAVSAEAAGKALRGRIAAAIDEVFERWSKGLGGMRPQDAIAEAVLGALPADGYCPHCGRGDAGPSPDAYEEMRQRAEDAEDECDQLRTDLKRQAQDLATWRATVAILDSGAPGTFRHRAAQAEAALVTILDRILDDIDHHRSAATQSAQKHPDVPALGQAHDGMAAGLHIAATRVAHGRPELVARVKERIDQADRAALPVQPQPACCVCGGGPVVYRNYREQPFCQPCANCQCVQNPCVRTGVNDPVVSADAAAAAEHGHDGYVDPNPTITSIDRAARPDREESPDA